MCEVWQMDSTAVLRWKENGLKIRKRFWNVRVLKKILERPAGILHVNVDVDGMGYVFLNSLYHIYLYV